MLSAKDIREHFEGQAKACDELGSPLTAAICRIAPDILGNGRLAERIANWPGNARADALSLRVCGGLHALVIRGMAPELASVYPPNSFELSSLREALVAAIAANDDFLFSYLDNPPQTNEVARSSMILGAALHVAEATHIPLAAYEIGASGGLNLRFSDYAYDFGNDIRWGGTDAPLTIKSEWSGNLPPLDANLQVVSHKACDRNPLDPRNPDNHFRLLSYVWADQTARLERLKKALAYAAERNASVETADAAVWVEREFSLSLQPGTVRMLYHTIVWQYLPEVTKARITTAVHEAGGKATPEAPLAWFRFENDEIDGSGLMELTLWPGGETRTLGRADFHGRWVRWQ